MRNYKKSSWFFGRILHIVHTARRKSCGKWQGYSFVSFNWCEFISSFGDFALQKNQAFPSGGLVSLRILS